MFDFRRAGIESSEQLVHLWVETFRQAYEGVHNLENIRAYCSKNFTLDAAMEVLSSDQIVCCIAYRNDQPSGYYVVKHHRCPIELDGDSSELKQIYILSSEFGKGLGKSLFENASEVVRNAGRNWLWLCVSDINYRAQAFYKKLNFKPASPGPVFNIGTDQLSSTIMVRKLQTSAVGRKRLASI
jgi:ribosomal protein S18 acetylase RimI-like enzyme